MKNTIKDINEVLDSVDIAEEELLETVRKTPAMILDDKEAKVEYIDEHGNLHELGNRTIRVGVKRCINCEYCVPEYHHAVCIREKEDNKLYIMPDEYGECRFLLQDLYIKGEE